MGWQWATNLSNLGHNVYVVTRRNNKQNIENSFKKKKFKIYLLRSHPILIKLFSRKNKRNFFSFFISIFGK